MSDDQVIDDDDAPTDALFEVEEEQQKTIGGRLRLLVHFATRDDRQAFSHLIGQRVGDDTESISWPVANTLPLELLKPAAEALDVEQPNLLDVDEHWRVVWRGMPAFSHQDLQPFHTITIYFNDKTSRRAFAELIDQPVTDSTQSTWFPQVEIDKVMGLRWRSTRPQNPQYPVYVPTKGRWDSAFTIKCMEKLGIPYYAVVQPQERHHYEPVVKTGTMLLLPEGLDGLVPTRNWIFEHAVVAGTERHWQLDDNIKSFFRYHENRQIHVADGTCMRIAEDFADRYENIAIAGFQYFMFIPRKQGSYPPYVFNTRVYSNSLINNRIPFRYRDVYNDDTDICLRAMKAGWCTVQFNAFLAWKQPTMQVKGGNTPIYLGADAVAAEWEAHVRRCKRCIIDVSPTCVEGRAILQKDGRWRMAESLVRQHPDVTTIGRRFRRWQHYVDYRQFRRNEPILRKDVVIPEGVNDYGLELITVEHTARQPSDKRPPSERASAARVEGPSALDFVRRLAERQDPPAKPEQPVPASQPEAQGKAPEPESKLLLADPQPDFPADRPASPELVPPASPEPVPPASPESDAATFKAFVAGLETRGHALVLRDGRPLITRADQLTPTDVTTAVRFKHALLALALRRAESSPDAVVADGSGDTPDELGGVSSAHASDEAGGGIEPPASSVNHSESLFEEPQTLTRFLGDERRGRVDADFTPDEPPDLTGIDSIVLNFATDGLEWARGNRPVGVTVSTMDGALVRFLPFGFRGGGNLDEEVVKRWAQEQLRGKKITNSKTKFDVHMAREWGVDLEAQGCTFSDIQHTAALLDDHRKRFALDVLAQDYLSGEQMISRVDESRHHEYHASEVAERERFTVGLVGKLVTAMYPELDAQELRTVQALEDDVIPAVVEMERNGSPIDLELLERYGRECNAAHDKLMWEISKEAGFAFEHTPSGWKRLIESLRLPMPEAFSESVLNEVDHPLIRKGQRAVQYASLNSKIFKAYPQHILDGILRYNINQLASDEGGTVSGRFSIGLVQQVPNEDNHRAAFGDQLFPRRLFIPGRGDYLEADAAQIEFRLLVHYSGNAKLLKAYQDDPWMSFHKTMQSMLMEYKPDMLYAHTKNYNFAAQYGARSIKLAVMMGFITEREGKEIRANKRWNDPRLNLIHQIEAAYKRAHPEAGALLDQAAHLAKPECDDYCKPGDALHRQFKHRGYVKTLMGRRSRFPNAYKTYIGLNRVLQGTGADIMKLKLAILHRERKRTGFVMRITNHDAALGDATTAETLKLVGEILNEQSVALKVPVLWKCGTGANWAECK